MTTTPTSGMAIQRYKIGYHEDEWGQRSSTPSGIPDASGSWVRYADHVAALAAGQATAAQPAVEASRFGSPELQAMIIARCVEKDQADSVQEDAALWHWLAEYLVGTRTDLDDEIVASETVNDLRKLVKAAIKQGEKQ